MGALIKLDRVWKTYDMGEVQVNALAGVSIEIKPKEFLAITGKSGSGKSTLMNLVGCLDKPSKGRLYLDGKNVELLSESELAQIRGRMIGFIFQSFNLIPTLTALENVMLPGYFQGINEYKLQKRAEELLKFVDMGDRMYHRPGQLSGGQMQRVAIARSLINDPEIILADEPTGALDSKTGEIIIAMLKELNQKKGKSVVMITHDLPLVKHASRVIELKDGLVDKEYTHGGRK